MAKRTLILSSFLIVLLRFCSTHAWVSPPLRRTTCLAAGALRNAGSHRHHCRSSVRLHGLLDFFSPYESKIPEELKDEIYRAEANTPAAKDRGQRVALYALISLLGIFCAFFNGFLTELRSTGPDGGPGVDLVDAGFDWVVDNFLFHFLFTNKIGGAICLLGGAGAGLLAEAELDTKRINAEKIFEELERRRDAKTKKNKASSPSAGRKKRRSGKERKRLSALSEVVLIEDTKQEKESETFTDVQEDHVTDKAVEKKEEITKEDKKGIFGGIKDLYDKADTMAASQALLLNKKLEDAGVVDKITDETGLKIIGKEEASKLQNKESNSENK